MLNIFYDFKESTKKINLKVKVPHNTFNQTFNNKNICSNFISLLQHTFN